MAWWAVEFSSSFRYSCRKSQVKSNVDSANLISQNGMFSLNFFQNSRNFGINICIVIECGHLIGIHFWTLFQLLCDTEICNWSDGSVRCLNAFLSRNATDPGQAEKDFRTYRATFEFLYGSLAKPIANEYFCRTPKSRSDFIRNWERTTNRLN